jgi:hypothetical protein
LFAGDSLDASTRGAVAAGGGVGATGALAVAQPAAQLAKKTAKKVERKVARTSRAVSLEMLGRPPFVNARMRAAHLTSGRGHVGEAPRVRRAVFAAGRPAF